MNQLKNLLKVFVKWTIIGLLSKVLFLLIYNNRLEDTEYFDWLLILWHGLRLDLAVAAYLTVIPGIIMIFYLWYSNKTLRWVWDTWTGIASILCSVAYVSNIALYFYWGFPLDSTPLLYLTTSPGLALASMAVWQMTVIPLGIVAAATVIFMCFSREEMNLEGSINKSKKKRITETVLMALCIIALIIPMRGGFATGTNHTGSVFYSKNIRHNHIAVNPIFSFVESVLHKEEIATRYRFMDDQKATALFNKMTCTRLRPDAAKHDYNVVLICLESFSKYIMSEGGHVKGVTPNLDRFANEGLYFTNIYANSFRTDRGLVSVLSGLPAQPTMSVMDIPRISTSLPSLANSLGNAGYATHFYYGGDTNFSNMRSYLIGSGFMDVTSQSDFPMKDATGKWGVADGPVFDRMMGDIQREMYNGSKPFFKVFMTSSSHEPFDVPDYEKLDSPELNAFSYTDHCLGEFIETLSNMPCWKKTLVVIVPDHLGAYPAQIDNYQPWRYEIPLIIMGGPIKQPQRINTVGSQIDICATVLAMLGREHKEFTYSKDLLDNSAPHFAFFSFPDAMGMADADNYIYYDNTSKKVIVEQGNNPSALLPNAKAYLQKLYDDLGKR